MLLIFVRDCGSVCVICGVECRVLHGSWLFFLPVNNLQAENMDAVGISDPEEGRLNPWQFMEVRLWVQGSSPVTVASRILQNLPRGWFCVPPPPFLPTGQRGMGTLLLGFGSCLEVERKCWRGKRVTVKKDLWDEWL